MCAWSAEHMLLCQECPLFAAQAVSERQGLEDVCNLTAEQSRVRAGAGARYWTDEARSAANDVLFRILATGVPIHLTTLRLHALNTGAAAPAGLHPAAGTEPGRPQT